MSNINTVGRVGATAATISDLASIPRNGLTIAGRAASAVTALGFLGGAAAVLAGASMVLTGSHNVVYGGDERTQFDGLFSALGGASYVGVGVGAIGLYAGASSFMSFFPGAGIPMAAFLGARTGMRISENLKFREEFERCKTNEVDFHNFLSREASKEGGKDALGRILGADTLEQITSKDLSFKEKVALVDQKSFANLMTHFLVAVLLLALAAAMIYCAVDPSSVAINYLFLIPAFFWLFNDTKGVPVFEYFNIAFEKLSEMLLASIHPPKVTLGYTALAAQP